MTTTATKTWNESNTATLTAGYAEGKALDVLAEELGKTVASVRSKLVALGLYKKAEKGATASKAGKATKADLAAKLREATGKELVGVEALTATTLTELVEYLVGADDE